MIFKCDRCGTLKHWYDPHNVKIETSNDGSKYTYLECWCDSGYMSHTVVNIEEGE